MSEPKELRHIQTYKTRLCLARAGEAPMMFPTEGSNCPTCLAREAEYDALHKDWRAIEAEHIAKIESGVIPKRKKRTG